MIGRTILSAAAILLGLFGGGALFGADVIAAELLRGAEAGEAIVQLAAAGLLGLAVADWMSRGNRIGGIYQRPLALGNLMLFVVAGLSLARALVAGDLPPPAIVPTAAFVLLALLFGWLAFVHDPLAADDVRER